MKTASSLVSNCEGRDTSSILFHRLNDVSLKQSIETHTKLHSSRNICSSDHASALTNSSLFFVKGKEES